jgi:DNA-binding MarR family transcriptional regulator
MSRSSFRDDPRQPGASFDRSETRPRLPRRSDRQERDPETEPRGGGPAPEPLRPQDQDRTRPYTLGRRTFLLRESEVRAMADIGTFRVVALTDLARYAYAGDTPRMERDIRRLEQHGLVVQKTLPASRRSAIRIVGLTKTGKRLLRSTNRLPEQQAIFHGIVKPREAKHDAALYRLFQAELHRLANTGSRPVRVVLDYELKRDLYRDRERLGERRNDPAEVAALAERHGLKAVNGKIPLPDLRIEYQTADLEQRRLDLELATHHYRPRGLAEKAKAGFALYSPRDDAPRLRRILDEQELTARIFAL